MLENVLQILGVDIDESGGEDQLMTECTRKQWSSLQVKRGLFETCRVSERVRSVIRQWWSLVTALGHLMWIRTFGYFRLTT